MNSTRTQPTLTGRFGDLAVDAGIATALAAMGYTIPTPIQQAAIPVLQSGRDVIGLARTGSGKTAGFGIPLIESVRPEDRRVQAIVLVPTRELASQVAAELVKLGAHRGVRVAAVYGGVGMGNQIAALRGNAHVVVGTPGRVLDHLGRNTMDLRAVRIAILDEADRMLDVGFAPAIDDILRRIPGPRQTALFSATFPTEVEALSRRHTRDAERVSVDEPGAALETLEERFVRVPEGTDKADILHELLIAPGMGMALVFRRTTHRTDKLARELERRGFRVAALHGRRTQGQRERALGALRAGQLQVLVATDIAARGLDIAGLTHVVNFDLPDTAENYTHRVGRTARMGNDGVAVTLIGPEDEEALRQIQRKRPGAASANGLATAAPAQGRPGQGRRNGRGGQAQMPARQAQAPAAGAHAGLSQRSNGRIQPTQSGAQPGTPPMPRQPRSEPARPTATAGQGAGSADNRRSDAAPGGRPAAGQYTPTPRAPRPAPDAPARDATTEAEQGWYPFSLGGGGSRQRR